MEDESSTTRQTRIMLVDDHTLVRAGLRMLMETRPHFQVVAEAANREQCLKFAESEKPDVVLLDIDLGKENGLDFLPELRELCPQAKVIVLTGVADPLQHEKAVSLGAVGLVFKDKASDILLKAVERVREGEVWIDRAILARLLSKRTKAADDPEAAKIRELTPREREIVQLIAEGLKNRQIADRVLISEATVRHHLTSIFAKLEVSDRLELLLYALRHGLAKPPSGGSAS